MAIAFARVSIHSRSQGHSAVAGSAYRSGEKLLDERTGELHSFVNRQDVKYSDILLPEGSDPKFLDRSTLWNEVERCEKRKDAQIAKDVILALPKELSLSNQIDMTRQFADYHFVSKGLVADIAIHDHGDGNPHAHIYITTRRLRGDAFDRYKARDLNPKFANGKGQTGFISEQDYWGDQWRDYQNNYFQSHVVDLMVDENHLLTRRHEGRIKSDEHHYLKEENKLRHEASIEIALNDPECLIALLSTRYAVFSERQIASLLFKSTETPEQFQQAIIQIKGHPDIICLGSGDDGRLRYTTRATYLNEAKMSKKAEVLSTQYQHKVSSKQVNKIASGYQLSDEQYSALLHIIQGPAISSIVGRAGTGKSYLMSVARDIWETSGFRVRGMAVSGIAAKGLEESSQIPSSTIASIKMRLHRGSFALEQQDILVMDEAGMTDLNDMAFIVDAVQQAGAKLVIVGDPNQLQPIGPGAPFRALVEQTGFAEMSQIRRQEDPGDQRASQALSLGNVEEALAYYEQKGALYWHPSANDAMNTLVDHWASKLPEYDIQHQMILAHRNVDVQDLNHLAREKLIALGYIAEDSTSVDVVRRQPASDGWSVDLVSDTLQLAPGDRILFRKNDKQLGVHNGELATVLSIQGTEMTVQIDRGKELTFNTQEYNEFAYGYAATIHKAQGTTVDHVYVYAGGYGWNRHLAYVALTRHRKEVELHIDRETYPNDRAFKDKVKQFEVKDSVLDWPISFAERRGFDPESLIGRFIERIGKMKETFKDVWAFINSYPDHAKHPDPSQPRHPQKETIHPLKDSTLEWDKLKAIDDPTAQWIDKYYTLTKEKSSEQDLNRIYQSISTLITRKFDEGKFSLEKITKQAPNLAKHIQENIINTHVKSKPVQIDWKASKYKVEWDALRQVDHPRVQLLVKLYDAACKTENQHSTIKLYQSMNSLISKISQNKVLFDQIKSITAKLSRTFHQCHLNNRAKEKDRERER